MSAGLKIALLFVAALLAQQAPTAPPRADGMIVGQVVDAATGKPLGVTIVTLVEGTGLPPKDAGSVLTTPDGRFVFSNLPPGDFGLTAVRAGYMAGIHGQRRPFTPGHPITLTAGQRQHVVFQLWKNAVISGTVVDEAGEPVIGIQVRAWRTRGSRGRLRPTPQSVGLTDDRGYYRIHNLPLGEYVVGVGERQIAVPQSWSERAFPSVRQPPGKPGTANAIAIGEQVMTVGRGGAIPPPPRGQRLFVYPPTFYPAAPTEQAAASIKLEAGSEQGGIDLQLQPVPTFRVAGRLISSQRASGITVRLSRAGVSNATTEMGESITVTDQGGAFAFPAVAAGSYVLRAAADARVPPSPDEPVERGASAELPVDVSSNVDDVVLTLEAGLQIIGRLEFDGTRPAPGADRLRGIRLLVYSARPDSPLRIVGAAARTETSGTFTTIGLPRGRYYFQIENAPEGWVLQSVTLNGRDVAATPIELSRGDVPGVVLRFTDRPAAITGMVRASEAPNSTAAVLLFPSDTARWTGTAPQPPDFRIVRTSRTGDYSITDLPEGAYYVVAVPDELADSYFDPELLERLSMSATLIPLAEGERRVVDLRTVSIK